MTDVEFFSRLALEYRLSLKSISKLSGINESEIKKYCINSIDYMAYKFLFDLDVVDTDDTYQCSKLKRLLECFNEINKGDYSQEEKNNNLDYLLNKTDIEVNRLLDDKDRIKRLSIDDYKKISRYRIKHAYSSNGASDYLHIDRRRLSSMENKYEGSIRDSLDKLEDFIRAKKNRKGEHKQI